MNKARWAEAKDIFEKAIAIDPDERLKFLDEACSDDKIVRREVEELLSSFDESKSFLETPAISVNENTLKKGQIIARYEIIEPIGAGGMGEVFLAKDKRLKRKVALKLLPAEFAADKEKLHRFEQEALAASSLNHPNILTIYEIGSEDGVNFIATEFIEGETLRQKIKRGNLTLPEILEISVQTVSAISAAHASGIVHRDIKPENIMIRRDRLIKVLDFGLAKPAKPIDIADSDRTFLHTKQGVIMGTVCYMSPEQTRGLCADERSDLWSFGVVLYEMVAGNVPFTGATSTDTLAAILTAEPKPLTDFNSEVPGKLLQVVTRTLQKDKDERYQSAEDLLADLHLLKEEVDYHVKNEANLRLPGDETAKSPAADSVTPDESTSGSLTGSQSKAISSAEYIAGEIRKNKLGFAVSLSLLILAIIGLGYWFFFNRWANTPIESIAVMPFVNDSGNTDVEYLADGMTETLIRGLSQVPNLTVKARSSVFRYKGKEAALKQIAEDLNVQAILTGRVAQHGGQLTLWLELVDARTENVILSEQYDRKESDLVALQTEIARDVSNKLRKLTGAEEQKVAKKYTENAEAYQLYLKGRYYWNKRTGEGMLKGIEYFDQAIRSDPQYALAYSGLADCYVLRAAPFPPNERLRNAKAAITQALEIDETLAEAHTSLGRIKSDYELDWAGAEREYKRALELNPNYATAHQWYALFLSFVGRNDEAIREAKRAKELEPLSLSINTTLGWVLYFMGNYDDALAQIRQTLEMDPNFADALYLTGRVYTAKKMYNEAIAASQKAISLDDDPKLIADLGYIYAMSAKSPEARQIIAKLENLPAGKYAPSYNIACIYAALGDKENAFKWLERAIEERQPELTRLYTDSWLDNLRSTPRLQELLQRIGRTPINSGD